jgi:phosphohistidine phosphatase
LARAPAKEVALKDKKSSTADCIFIVRHGAAEGDHPLGDEARALTREGRAAFRALASEIGPELGLRGIVSSPLVRAVQTAEILADACDVDDVRTDAALIADSATALGITALAQKLGPGWALVGHNPSLAQTYAAWLGTGAGQLQLRKGAIVAFRPGEARQPPWTPVFSISPGRKKDRF